MAGSKVDTKTWGHALSLRAWPHTGEIWGSPVPRREALHHDEADIGRAGRRPRCRLPFRLKLSLSHNISSELLRNSFWIPHCLQCPWLVDPLGVSITQWCRHIGESASRSLVRLLFIVSSHMVRERFTTMELRLHRCRQRYAAAPKETVNPGKLPERLPQRPRPLTIKLCLSAQPTVEPRYPGSRHTTISSVSTGSPLRARRLLKGR